MVRTIFMVVALWASVFTTGVEAEPVKSDAAEALSDTLLRLAENDTAVRRLALMDLARTGDARMEALFDAFRAEGLHVWNGRVVRCDAFEEKDGAKMAALLDPVTTRELMQNGVAVVVPASNLVTIAAARPDRKLAQTAGQLLKLFSPDSRDRRTGIKKCAETPMITEALPQLRVISKSDPDRRLRALARESLLLMRLADSPVPEARLAMVRALGNANSVRALPALNEMKVKAGDDAELTKAIRMAVLQIEAHQRFVDRANTIFQGISLGSVLVLIALGLAITFGLMGVINMAHGELMMIGAFTTYQLQLWFTAWYEKGGIPVGALDGYYLVALPASFLVAALVGLVMEVLVVRHLYRRPIESLLATWGVGLILIQCVRLHYGDNVGVNAPLWARGGVEVMQDVILPYSRMFIVALCAVGVCAVVALMKRTALGLRIRATMQNREMASGLGVNTVWVDKLTFALGSGLAGLAGCAWTLIGGVTPDMGQKNFIVDAFLVVVTGGVGELAGVICSGLGIGLFTKWLEPLTINGVVIGAIWAKVVLLVVIMAFIQFKPAGLFAQKGRLADV